MATILSVSVPADLRAALDAERSASALAEFFVSEAIRAYVTSREREGVLRRAG